MTEEEASRAPVVKAAQNWAAVERVLTQESDADECVITFFYALKLQIVLVIHSNAHTATHDPKHWRTARPATPNASPTCFCAICSPTQGELWANVEGSLHRKRDGFDLSDNAARLARFRRAAGDLAPLSIDLTPGSRGRYLPDVAHQWLHVAWDVAVDRGAPTSVRPFRPAAGSAVGVAFNNGGEPGRLGLPCAAADHQTRDSQARPKVGGAHHPRPSDGGERPVARGSVAARGSGCDWRHRHLGRREGASMASGCLANGSIAVIGVASTAGFGN